jgi:hypothetical protein
MAKKTVARRRGATRRTALAPHAKAPLAPAKLAPGDNPPARAARGTKKAASSLPASPAVEALKPATKSPRADAARAFVKGLVERGEVAASGAPLEAGMTHEVVGQKTSGTPQVTRRRFSLR